jgi:hypothetical protein
MVDKTESVRPNAGHALIEGTLSVPVLEFDLGEEIDQQQKEDSWLHGVGRSSKTLVKYDDLRIVLISMKANTQMHEHKQPLEFPFKPLPGMYSFGWLEEPWIYPLGISWPSISAYRMTW